MVKKTAPTKATSGDGHSFEAKVGAYFAVDLLVGQLPFRPEDGLVSRIDFQVRVDGWYLDDMVLTMERAGEFHKRAFSVKSNPQFTAKKAPPDFVKSAWELFLHEGSSVFECGKDFLGIVVAPLAQRISEGLAALSKKALSVDSADLSRRIDQPLYASQVERDLFDSFACPTDIAQRHGIGPQDTGKLLSRVLVYEFDFGWADSRRREADRACREALIDESLSENLWEALLVLVEEQRAEGGYLDRAKIIARLGSRFEFKNSPRYVTDWQKINVVTLRTLATINDSIAGKVVLDRAAARSEVEKAFASSPVVCLIGASGLGKTAVAKSFVAGRGNALWFSGQDLEKTDLASFEVKWKLSHAVEDVLASAQRGLIIIDAVDRLLDEQGFRNAALIIQKGSALADTQGWRVLLTCQPEEWARVQRELFRAQVDSRKWQVTELAVPTRNEVQPVWKAFPALGPIATRIDLHPVLLRPKVLDLLASRIELDQAPDFKSWVGESDFIAWFWETEVRKGAEGPVRARFAQQLAERQAVMMRHEVPSSEFSADDLRTLQSLLTDRICTENDHRVGFAHDLYGDWARQTILVGRAPTLGHVGELAEASPLWHKAVRLYGLYLIEGRDKISEWVRLILQATESKEHAGRDAEAQQLLLEAAVITPNAKQTLEKALPDLLRSKGTLLKQLLERFLHVATIPDPQIMALARAKGLNEEEAALYNRLPLWPFWLPVLTFLSAHSEEVIPLAPWAIAKICDAWLRRTGQHYPLRRQTAAMALRLAEIFGVKDEHDQCGLHGDAEQMMCRAALAGAGDLPDEVVSFALTHSERIEPPITPAAPTGHQPVEVRRTLRPPWVAKDARLPPPFPDGPKNRVSAAFRRVCLSHDALLPLIQARPDAAREVLLACLIDEPNDMAARGHMNELHYEHGIKRPDGWYPAFYNRGPFLQFLFLQPDAALDCIIRLANHAADRDREHAERLGRQIAFVEVPVAGNIKRFQGGYQTMYWFRGDMGPEALEAVLMSLEKYLYDVIDAGRDVTPFLGTVLEKSRSVAPLGVLVTVGKKQQELFKGILSPLLTVAEFYEWERARAVGADEVWRISWGTPRNGSAETDLAIEWNTMAHRRRTLEDAALSLFHRDPTTRKILEEVRRDWEKRAHGLGEAGDKLLNLAAVFDPDNWKPDNTDPAARRLIFTRPQALQERNAPHLRRVQAAQTLILFPSECREVIDGKRTLSVEHLDVFWKQLQDIAAMDVTGSEEPERKQHAICAGIAVLTLKHRDWLFADASKKEWCCAHVLRVIKQPPPQSDYDSSTSRASWYWDRSCAQAVPVFWAENTSSKEWRFAIARLALSPHFETVSYLFLGSLFIRDQLGESFLELQHLLLLWSSEHAAWYEERRGRDLPDLDKRGGRLIELFVAGEVPAVIPDWDKVEAHRKIHKRQGPGGKNPRQSPGFEIQLLEAAFRVFPLLSQARDDVERARWIALWRNALGVTLRMIGKPDEDGLESVPYDYDDFVLERIAEMIVEMRPDEHPEILWQPLLALGWRARYWVENFFRCWFRVGCKVNSIDSAFFREWQAMIACAKRAAGWKGGPDSDTNYHFELWYELLGLSLHDQLFWRKERRPIANVMKPHFKEWADAHLADGGAAKLFSSLLTRDATEDLIPDGLVWLDDGMHRASDWYWHEREICPELASFLAHAWGRCGKEIRAVPSAMKAFNRMLAELASRSEPLALQLRDQIARSR